MGAFKILMVVFTLNLDTGATISEFHNTYHASQQGYEHCALDAGLATKVRLRTLGEGVNQIVISTCASVTEGEYQVYLQSTASNGHNVTELY